jgi:hypothetical protein
MKLRPAPGVQPDMWQRVRQNKDERYHFLQRIESGEDARGEGLAELSIDFKR